MTYALILYGVVMNIIVLDDPSLIPQFFVGYDACIRIDDLTPIPQIGWYYNAALQIFYPPATYPIVNPDGSINVIVEPVPNTNSTVVSTYGEVLLVPSGATTQIVTYTVPVGYQAVLQRCPVSGENIARYDLLINTIIQDTLRTMFGGDLTQIFDFTTGNTSGLPLNAGDIVTIQVLHNRPYAASFESRIQVLQILLET